MRPQSFDSLHSFRRRARLLLRDVRSADAATALAAAARLARRPAATAADLRALVAERATIRLRDALDAVAREAGHEHWSGLVERAAALAAAGTTPAIDADSLFRRRGGMAHGWFSSHAEARAALRDGLVLLPYGAQAALVDESFLASLGFDENDRDLRALGPDWTRPRAAGSWRPVAVRLALVGCEAVAAKRVVLPAEAVA